MEDWDYLKKLSRMESEEDIKEFERRVWELAATKDPEVLENLIDLFDDKCPYYEIMYSLVHAIEDNSNFIYVNCLLRKIQKGLNAYPYWISILLFRTLNDDECLSIFRSNMHLADRGSLLKLFDIMEEESPHHRGLISELRKELEDSKSS